MHTQVQTPQEIFTLPQHLTVPLFQRPYVWTEEDQLDPLWRDIRRVAAMIDTLIRVWPAPEGHTVELDQGQATPSQYVGLRALVAAGVLTTGDVLTSRAGGEHTAVIGEEGTLHIGDKEFPSVTSAAKFARGAITNGWKYWRVPDGRSLSDVRHDYLARGQSSSRT